MMIGRKDVLRSLVFEMWSVVYELIFNREEEMSIVFRCRGQITGRRTEVIYAEKTQPPTEFRCVSQTNIFSVMSKNETWTETQSINSHAKVWHSKGPCDDDYMPILKTHLDLQYKPLFNSNGSVNFIITLSALMAQKCLHESVIPQIIWAAYLSQILHVVRFVPMWWPCGS